MTITCILSDVDGVLTDGRITFDENGVESKSFHARDGQGIKCWLDAGFTFAVVTARRSDLVTRRMAELKIEHVIQGSQNKLEDADGLLAKLGCDWAQTAFVGDDLADLSAIRRAGLGVTPADGATDIHAAADLVLQTEGGRGAVRELIEHLLRQSGRWDSIVKQKT